IAIGWAALTRLLAAHGWQRRAGQVALAALYAWAVWQSLGFLAARASMYEEGTRLLRDAAAASAAAPASAELLYVNFPAWKAPREPAFPLGNTGVTFVPEYVLLGQALHVNGGGPAAVTSRASRAVPPGWPDHYGPHGHWASEEELREAAGSATASYVVRYRPDGPRLEPWTASWREELPSPRADGAYNPR